MSFESFVADFIKTEDQHSIEKYYMIGIIAYKFDHSKMMNNGTLNLYPFTLNEKDDPTKWEITIPNTNILI